MTVRTLEERALRLAVAGVTPARVARAVTALGGSGGGVTTAAVLSRLEGETGPVDDQRVSAVREELADQGARVHVAGGEGYPSRLALAWPDLGAPLWLLVRAPQGGLADGPAVAVVGTRHPSLDGLDTARALGAVLARAGVTVVSGLARGIDQAAHRGALDARGRTVAVLGAGFGADYPRGDGHLREQIAESGGLVTELLPGTPPRGHQFLSRNRIIAGLADATVVVEGRTRSGALATAQRAAELGREVLACPGSINAPASRAPLDLIRDGATVLTRLEDAVEAAGVPALRSPDERDAPPDAELSPAEEQLLGLLGATPVGVDRLVRASGRSAQEVLAIVAELTALGLARRSGSGFVRPARP